VSSAMEGDSTIRDGCHHTCNMSNAIMLIDVGKGLHEREMD